MPLDFNRAMTDVVRQPRPDVAPFFESDDAPDEDVEVCPSAEEINAPPESVDGTVMPREWSARYRHWTSEQKSEWRATRNRCRVDPIFCSSVLGMDLVETPHLVLFQDLLMFRGEEKDGRWVPAPFDTLTVKHKKMLLASRGVCKTTSIRVVMVMALLNYVDIRICFLTGSDGLGKLQLAAIKNHFENPSTEFLRLFPEYCLKSKQNKASGNWHDVHVPMGNSQKFSVPCRLTSVFAEPTMKISTRRSQ